MLIQQSPLQHVLHAPLSTSPDSWSARSAKRSCSDTTHTTYHVRSTIFHSRGISVSLLYTALEDSVITLYRFITHVRYHHPTVNVGVRCEEEAMYTKQTDEKKSTNYRSKALPVPLGLPLPVPLSITVRTTVVPVIISPAPTPHQSIPRADQLSRPLCKKEILDRHTSHGFDHDDASLGRTDRHHRHGRFHETRICPSRSSPSIGVSSCP